MGRSTTPDSSPVCVIEPHVLDGGCCRQLEESRQRGGKVISTGVSPQLHQRIQG